MQYIAFDSHKRYTWACVETETGTTVCEKRIEHGPGELKSFLSRFDSDSPVALETIGSWYWIVDEIESAGMVPKLVNARKAKWMMASSNKTDKLDARGMNRLQRTGTLPTVWIPSGELRDARELYRTRQVLVHYRTRVKNRIHAILSKYGLSADSVSDLFGVRGREELATLIKRLPEHARFVTQLQCEHFDEMERRIESLEIRMKEVFKPLEDRLILESIPGIGFYLSVLIVSEIGDPARFPSAAHFASYAGTTPTVKASGGKVRYGQLRSDSNRYLKWAFVEAANTITINRRRWPYRYVSRLYERIRERKGHQVAVGAVARHLAESVWWVLSKREKYREPGKRESLVSSTGE